MAPVQENAILNHKITTFLNIITSESYESWHAYNSEFTMTVTENKKSRLNCWGLLDNKLVYYMNAHFLCVHFLDERTYSQWKLFTLQNYWYGTCSLCPLPIPTPLLLNKRDHQWNYLLLEVRHWEISNFPTRFTRRSR